MHNVLVVTTLTATAATVQAIRALRERATDVLSLQEIHGLASPVLGGAVSHPADPPRSPPYSARPPHLP